MLCAGTQQAHRQRVGISFPPLHRPVPPGSWAAGWRRSGRGGGASWEQRCLPSTMCLSVWRERTRGTAGLARACMATQRRQRQQRRRADSRPGAGRPSAGSHALLVQPPCPSQEPLLWTAGGRAGSTPQGPSVRTCDRVEERRLVVEPPAARAKGLALEGRATVGEGVVVGALAPALQTQAGRQAAKRRSG